MITNLHFIFLLPLCIKHVLVPYLTKIFPQPGKAERQNSRNEKELQEFRAQVKTLTKESDSSKKESKKAKGMKFRNRVFTVCFEY